MKIAVVGSRNINISHFKKIKYNIIKMECTEIVTDGAIGVDNIAEKIAKNLNIKTKIFYPDYKKYGKLAPLIRNKQIVDYSDKILAFWYYKSKGTRNTILYAIKINKEIEIFIID